jgi:pimeloyl-ACP methyl ester carboxylesterase
MLVLALSGCSLALLEQHHLEHQFRRAGLVEHQATVGGADMHWWAGGEGPPLLLIHGFGGDAVFGWHGQLGLAEHHTLIVPDLAWFGRSRGPADDFSVAMQERAIVGVLDAEKADRADVIGISYGGFVAGALASLAPDRVGKLVIVDSPGPAFAPADVDALLGRFGASKAEDIFVPTSPAGVRTLIELAYVDPPGTPKLLLRDLYTNLFTDSADEKRHLLSTLQADRDVMTAAWNVRQPTLVVWGEEDPVFPLAIGRSLAAGIPGAAFASIPRTAHAPNVEDPRAFDAIVGGFLDPPGVGSEASPEP